MAEVKGRIIEVIEKNVGVMQRIFSFKPVIGVIKNYEKMTDGLVFTIFVKAKTNVKGQLVKGRKRGTKPPSVFCIKPMHRRFFISHDDIFDEERALNLLKPENSRVRVSREAITSL